jgi:hypothetical protein
MIRLRINRRSKTTPTPIKNDKHKSDEEIE